MRILRIIYEGFNQDERCFANCIILVREVEFSITRVHEISKANKFLICSEIRIDRLIEEKCLVASDGFSDYYIKAKNNGYAFKCFKEESINALNGYYVPRFSEKDFENIIYQLGGMKVPESSVMSPDFFLTGVVMELKDLQTDSLFNAERQNNIAEAFKNHTGYSINLDPTINFGEPTEKYRSWIENTIKNHFKKASKQIRMFASEHKILSAGVIFLNTGMFSLPHETFKAIVEDIITHESTTIKFGLVFSQIMQSNGWDLYAVFSPDFVGEVPEQVKALRPKLQELIDAKMTQMMRSNPKILAANSLYPISFCKNNKIFYWSPGRLTLPWEKEIN